jgi:hypothetical protein
VAGEATISVADVDLIYLGLQVILTSIEGARRHADPILDGVKTKADLEGAADAIV